MKPQSSFLLACVLFVLFNLSPLHNLWGLFLPQMENVSRHDFNSTFYLFIT